MEMFGLTYPIFAPHGTQTSPELASAVSNPGAMSALASLDDRVGALIRLESPVGDDGL